MQKLLVTSLLVLASFVTKGQDLGSTLFTPENTGRFVGFNANPIMSRVIPFNITPTNFRTPSVVWRNLKKGKGVEFGAGFDLSENLESVFLSVGYAKKARLHKNFFWSSSFGLMTSFFADATSIDENAFFGLYNTFGVEYQINEIVSVAARAELLLGGGADIIINLRPPSFILVYFRVPRK
jgi:hypothetical protein